MTTTVASPTHLTDTELLREVARAAAQERSATSHLIALLAEIDARRLYLGEGCSSLFTYCTQVLRLSEHAAYGRITAARCAGRFSVVLDLLAEGAVTLTTIGLLAPHLTSSNMHALLTAARHKSKREVEQIVVALRPLPPVPSSIRKLPGPAREHTPSPPPAPAEDRPGRSGCADPPEMSAGDLRDARLEGSCRPRPAPTAGAQTSSAHEFLVSGAARRPPIVTALAPERYKVQFTISRDTHDKLRRAQELMRHVEPTGDPAAIFDRALTLLVAELERTRLAANSRPRRPRQGTSSSRHVPAAIKRQVWARDGGQCAFVGTKGRCSERGFLEVHHVVPFADGGRTIVDNLELRCRAHNQYEAKQWFGPLLVREGRPGYCTNRSGPA